MKLSLLFRKICICALFIIISPLAANSAIVNFSGQLDAIEFNTGAGVYSSTILGTTFYGSIDDITFSGEISDGIIITSFGSNIAAGGIEVSNNFILDAGSAELLNVLAGYSMFSVGDILDGINIEGDVSTSGDGRIEIGLSYLFKSDTFNDENLNNYPFNPDDLLFSLFFIYEEDLYGDDVYSAVGELNAVPLPASIWLFCSGFVSLAGFVKRKKMQTANKN